MRISRPARLWGHGIFAVVVIGLLATIGPRWVDEQRGDAAGAVVVQVLTPRTAELRFITKDALACTVVLSWGNTEHFLRPGDEVMVRHGRAHPCSYVRRTSDHSDLYLLLFACVGWAFFWVISGFAHTSDYNKPA